MIGLLEMFIISGLIISIGLFITLWVLVKWWWYTVKIKDEATAFALGMTGSFMFMGIMMYLIGTAVNYLQNVGGAA